MAKRNRVFRHITSNVRTAPKDVDRRIAERKLQLAKLSADSKPTTNNRWQDIEDKIRREFMALDLNLEA